MVCKMNYHGYIFGLADRLWPEGAFQFLVNAGQTGCYPFAFFNFTICQLCSGAASDPNDNRPMGALPSINSNLNVHVCTINESYSSKWQPNKL